MPANIFACWLTSDYLLTYELVWVFFPSMLKHLIILVNQCEPPYWDQIVLGPQLSYSTHTPRIQKILDTFLVSLVKNFWKWFLSCCSASGTWPDRRQLHITYRGKSLTHSLCCSQIGLTFFNLGRFVNCWRAPDAEPLKRTESRLSQCAIWKPQGHPLSGMAADSDENLGFCECLPPCGKFLELQPTRLSQEQQGVIGCGVGVFSA